MAIEAVRYHSYDDHPYDTCIVGKDKFAIFKQSITSDERLYEDLSDYIVVVLFPLEASHLTIRALSLIALANLAATNGSLTIMTRGKVLSLTGQPLDREDNTIVAQDVAILTLEPRHRNTIIDEFYRGILAKDTEVICGALTDISEALKSFDGEEEAKVASSFTLPQGITITTAYDSGDIFDTCHMNGAKVAIFKKAVHEEDIYLDFREYIVVVPYPLVAKNKLTIKALAVIALANLIGSLSLDISGEAISLVGQRWLSDTHEVDMTSLTLKAELHGTILGKFEIGYLGKCVSKIFDALMDTYRAIDTPAKERTLDMRPALRFFHIPLVLRSA